MSAVTIQTGLSPDRYGGVATRTMPQWQVGHNGNAQIEAALLQHLRTSESIAVLVVLSAAETSEAQARELVQCTG